MDQDTRGQDTQLQDGDSPQDQQTPGAFFYSLDDLPAKSIEEIVVELGLSEDETQKWFELFGRDLMTKTILLSPDLNITHESIGPGGKVKPHRHGTNQITYVLKGSLSYGNRKTTAGMGYYSPNRNYAWTAGPEGAEWLEIHAGLPQPYVE